ncbi:alpha/beta-hydrolase [Dothidotthia symphoricarpi CBS 119687]|uniref:Alpha/beta-hydrolase n=1 Tax=Dothidotthia symphoricarpi CBS 119687 TaxID=1392245 RepID=A0A6A5ZY45_9PLEO|nr:alpha/beta-hydrolase [Dothidotthia symphoricarpi CBS 119687]KAF2123945.1 alpha/beta-hydrolase [Dothidotthia symphoricarpi CBS 119687]
MTSNSIQRCCVTGVKHEGTPKGEVKRIDGVRTYFTYPENGATQNAILIMPDVLGIDFLNVQLIADQFAANGYLTVIPDYFNGNVMPFNPPKEFDFWAWVKNNMPHPETVDPVIENTIKHLRGDLGVKRLGGVGYCFGGKYVFRWLKEGGLDAGYAAHPTFVTADEVKGIKGPLSISAAEIDQLFTAEKRREAEDILRDLPVPYQMFLYSDVSHGFATKGDLSHAKARFAKEQAFLQAVFWLDEYVKKG